MGIVVGIIVAWFLLSGDRVAAPARSALGSAIRSGAGAGHQAALDEWNGDAPYRANRLHDRQAWLQAPDRGRGRRWLLNPAHRLWRAALRWGGRLDAVGVPVLGNGVMAGLTAGRDGWRARRDDIDQQRATHGTLLGRLLDRRHTMSSRWGVIRSWRTRVSGGCIWQAYGSRPRLCGKPVNPRAGTLCTEHARELDSEYPDLPRIIPDSERDPYGEEPNSVPSVCGCCYRPFDEKDLLDGVCDRCENRLRQHPNTVPDGFPDVPAPPLGLVGQEDDAEDAGTLTADDRQTCSTCRTWVTDEHRDSAAHKRAIGIPERWVFDPAAGRFRPPNYWTPTTTTNDEPVSTPAVGGGTDPTGRNNVVPLTRTRTTNDSTAAQLDIADLEQLATVLEAHARLLADAIPPMKAAAETSRHLPEALAFHPGPDVMGLLAGAQASAPDPETLTAWMEEVQAVAQKARERVAQMEVIGATGVQGTTAQVGSTGS